MKRLLSSTCSSHTPDDRARTPTLTTASILCILAAMTHVGVAVFAMAGFPIFGSGDVAVVVQLGWWTRWAASLSLIVIFGVSTAYGLSAAGLVPELPRLRIGLVAMACLLVYRGTFALDLFLVHRVAAPEVVTMRLVGFTAIPLALGLAYAVGTYRLLARDRKQFVSSAG